MPTRGALRDQDITVVPTIDVIGERVTSDCAYLIEAGKRFGFQAPMVRSN